VIPLPINPAPNTQIFLIAINLSLLLSFDSFNPFYFVPFLQYRHAALHDTLPPQQRQKHIPASDTADFKNENRRDRRVFDCVVEEAGPGGVGPAPVK